ncbi:MAG: hypothetical protein JRG95_23500, partial [Deltaproteobacteria bacterium]|nr:hypothetical protein [Deltaproteobacteria bacterium]
RVKQERADRAKQVLAKRVKQERADRAKQVLAKRVKQERMPAPKASRRPKAPEPWRLRSRDLARAEIARVETNIREFEAMQAEPTHALGPAHESVQRHRHEGEDLLCDEPHFGDEEIHVYRSCDAWGCQIDEVVVVRIE